MKIEAEFDGNLSNLEKIMKEQAGRFFKVKHWENEDNIFYTLNMGPMSIGSIHCNKENKYKIFATYELGLLMNFFKDYAERVFYRLAEETR